MQAIKNGKAAALINEFGAELKSYKIKSEELIWQSDPSIWSGSAPILFPVIGRLKKKSYLYNGKVYKMPKHGFATKNFFDVVDKSESSVRLSFESDEEVKVFYPFDFKFDVKFSILESGRLTVDYEVRNNDSVLMYFSIGSHPGINIPTEDSVLDDYYIEFETNETLYPYKLVNELLERQEIPYLSDEKIIKLHKNIFNEDALIFTNVKSRNIYVKNNKTGRNVKVGITNHPDLGIWAKPSASYVCIEPWFGHDDPVDVSGHIENKPGILTLEPGNVFKTGYSIELA
ncbi:MAG TPA: aldose 1-epimerase family protein [Victivallales bacterium]|nr:aldose 1-epimerase family protein [Victivallales bacterium]